MESLVIPHLDYWTVSYLDASLTIRTFLQRLANVDIRHIFEDRRDSRITAYRQQLGWLRNDSRLDYFALLLMCRVFRMKEPPILLPHLIHFSLKDQLVGLS